MQTVESSEEDNKQEPNAITTNIVVDLNNPYKIYWEFNKQQDMTIKIKESNIWNVVAYDERMVKYFQGLQSRKDENNNLLPLPFSLWFNMERIHTLAGYFNNLLSFILGLMNCSDQLFYKYMCYFKSPRRLFDQLTVSPCSLFSDPLVKFREFYKKCKQTRKLSSTENTEWINTILQIARITSKEESFNFGGIQFSTENTVICNNKYGVIGFKRETETLYSDESLKQSLYTFPVMMTKVLATDPSKFDYNYQACIILNQDGITSKSIKE